MKSLISIVCLLLASAANADSIGVLGCGTDKGISVEISRLPGARTLDAQVVENGGATDVDFSNFQVRKVLAKRGVMGAPMIFSGKNFELNLIVDAAPVDGQIRSHLTAKTANGRDLSEDLLCTLY